MDTPSAAPPLTSGRHQVCSLQYPSERLSWSCMAGSLSASLAAVDVTGLNYTILIVVALIAVAALGVAWVFAREVLAASEGTDNMKEIAGAVQEGAAAYLSRQFRTLAVFAMFFTMRSG